jgi:hypothetical protein
MMPEIDKIVRAGRQRVPGMTKDEIKAEMIESLWNARMTYDRDLGVTFEAYWWSIWLHRKADLIKYSLRAKRDVRREILHGDDWFADAEDEDVVERLPILWPVVADNNSIPEPPTTVPVERRVWCLLAVGATRQEVLALCDLPKRRYYQIIHGWRTPQVRKELLHE